jgi:hypothetical protein
MTSGDRRRTTRRFSLAGWARNSDQLDLQSASFEASLREAHLRMRNFSLMPSKA